MATTTQHAMRDGWLRAHAREWYLTTEAYADTYEEEMAQADDFASWYVAKFGDDEGVWPAYPYVVHLWREERRGS